jgi:hypothetical protein
MKKDPAPVSVEASSGQSRFPVSAAMDASWSSSSAAAAAAEARCSATSRLRSSASAMSRALCERVDAAGHGGHLAGERGVHLRRGIGRAVVRADVARVLRVAAFFTRRLGVRACEVAAMRRRGRAEGRGESRGGGRSAVGVGDISSTMRSPPLRSRRRRLSAAPRGDGD